MERQAKDGTIYKKIGPDDWEPVTRQAKDGTTFKKIGQDDWEPVTAEPTPKPQQKERPWYDVKAENIAPGFFEGLNKIDKYTAAPIRKFVTESLTGDELKEAPTGADQAKMMGASDTTYKESWGVPPEWGGDVSPADIYGAMLEIVQDPFVIGAAVKRGFKGAKLLADSPKARKTLQAMQEQGVKSSAQSGAKAGASVEGGGTTVEQTGKMFNYKAPQSLEELRQWNPEKGTGDLLGKTRLQEIENSVPDLRTKPLKYHYDMMENPKAMKELKLKFENLPTEDAKKIATYNQEIVNESTRKINQTVGDLAGAEPKSLTDAGYDFIGSVKEKYKAEKKALGPMFDQLQKRSSELGQQASKDLIQGLGENTRLNKLLSQDETGNFFLKKNTPRSGLSDSEHKILSRVVDDLNDGMTFKELQDTREFLRKSVDPSNPSATSEISKVRSMLLGQLEEMASGMGDDVGQVFKKYAKNERARESVEKIIGGKIENFDQMFSANPDKVVKKIFSNPNYTEVVRGYVGPEKVNQMVASYINSGINKATDSSRGFSPSKFKNWIKSNRNILNANLDSETLTRLEALSDYGYYGKRFLDEVNPSGTAASLKEMLTPGTFSQRVRQEGLKSAVTSEVGNRISSALNQKSAVKSVDEMLGGKPPTKKKVNPSIKNKASKILDETSDFQKTSAGIRLVGNELKTSTVAEEKKKGPTKWANDGFNKVINSIKDEKIKNTLKGKKTSYLKDKEIKKLLIQASDLKPNSKAMNKIVDRINSRIKRSQK